MKGEELILDGGAECDGYHHFNIGLLLSSQFGKPNLQLCTFFVSTIINKIMNYFLSAVLLRHF